MNEKIRYFIAGIFIGLSELLPGISGATVALMFGVYEKILTFLRKFKEFNLIIPLLLGMILSVFVFSSLINFLYENFTNLFNLLISLLMIGYGIYLVTNTYLNENINKGKSFYLNLFLAILIGLSLSGFYISGYLYQEPYPFTLLVFGFVACSFLLFPGISGSAFLLSVGAYPLIIGSISNFNLEVLFPFGIGMLLAVTTMPRFINKAYSKYGKSILVFFGGLIFAAGINNFL
ncbi:MAG: undecaprenyl phosphate translocase family protein [Gammaproteobacteria bacterium]|tara:strand:- start:30 stop:728 length:699 start_codon:yes stop_codon:yes gene_type:complete